MPVPPPTEEFHPIMIQTLTKLVTSISAIVIALVSALYMLLRQTDAKQQDQLDAGQDEFTNLKIDIAKIQKDVAAIREWVTEIETDFDSSEIKRVQDHESMLLIKDQHFRNHKEEVK